MADPSLIDAARRAELLADVGRFAEAETVVRTALSQAPADAELLTMLGYLLRVQQRHLDALTALEAATAAAPGHGDAHVQRAWTLIGVHRVAEAISAASEAVRLGPHRPDRHLVLALALAEGNRLREARKTVREALRLAPRSASALLTLAEIERQAGKPKAARAAARQALAIDPAGTRGRHILAMLDADRIKVRRSMRALAGIARDRPGDPDLAALTWPIRRVVVAPRWWLSGAGVFVAVAGFAGPAAPARFSAGLAGAITVGYALRVLTPAGRLPWKTLSLSAPLVRRCFIAGLAVIAMTVSLFAGYAAGGPPALPIAAVAAGPLLWICMVGERLGLATAGNR